MLSPLVASPALSAACAQARVVVVAVPSPNSLLSRLQASRVEEASKKLLAVGLAHSAKPRRPQGPSSKAGLQPGVARARSFRRDLSSCCSPLTLAVSSHSAQAPARTELQLPSARTTSCCSRRCRPACPCRYPWLFHQGTTHSPLLFPSPPLTLFAVGLPASCSIAPARRTSAAAWEMNATWHVCNGDLCMVPPPAAAVPSPAFLGSNPCSTSNSCALLRAAAAAASARSRAVRRAAGRPTPLSRPAFRYRPQASCERRYRRR